MSIIESTPLRTSVVKSVVAVTDHVEAAGAVTWWSLSGDVSHEVLSGALLAAGLAPQALPPETSAQAALRIAVYGQTNKRRLARPLGRNEGWGLVDETLSDNGKVIESTMNYRAWMEDGKFLRIEKKTASGWFPGSADAVACGIEEAFKATLDVVPQQVVGGWLVDRAAAVKAIRLRDSGGIYFVPKPALEGWRAMAGALKACSGHVVYELPAMRTEEAVEAIMAAVLADASRTEQELATDLAEGKFGARGLKARAERCEEAIGKLATYEELLGRNLQDMAGVFQNLRANLVAAALAAEAEDSDGK